MTQEQFERIESLLLQILNRKPRKLKYSETEQEASILRVIASFEEMSWQNRHRKGMLKSIAQQHGLLPLGNLKAEVIKSPEFKNDPDSSFDRILQSLIEAGLIAKANKDYTLENFNYKGTLLVVNNTKQKQQ